VTADDGFEPQLGGFLAMVEDFPADIVADGKTFRAGWSMFTLRAQPDGSLAIAAPDRLRGGETTDLSMEASVLTMQVTTLRRLGVDPKDCAAEDKLVVEQGAAEADEVYFHRTPTTTDGDSGWFLGVARPGERGPLGAATVGDLIRLRPDLVAFVQLPDDHIVFVNGREVRSVVDGANTELWATPES
jgi:hypothetical protein